MPEHLVTLEMKGLIENWRFSRDGSINILVENGVRSNCCGKLRYWFVNRDGETHCWDCDSRTQAERLFANARVGLDAQGDLLVRRVRADEVL